MKTHGNIKMEVVGALACMDNADFEEQKKSKSQHRARCDYLSEITTRTRNLKKYCTCTYS